MELVCRACLDQTKTEDFVSIFEDELAESFERCSTLKIYQEDPYPKYLCFSCCNVIRSFDEFRSKCVQSQVKWKSYSREDVSITNKTNTITKVEVTIQDLYEKVDSSKETTNTLKNEFKEELNQFEFEGNSDLPLEGQKISVLKFKSFKKNIFLKNQMRNHTNRKHAKKTKPNNQSNAEYPSRDPNAHNDFLHDPLITTSNVLHEPEPFSHSEEHQREQNIRKKKVISFKGQCEMCGRKFVYKAAMVRHMKYYCNMQKELPTEDKVQEKRFCGICEETLPSTGELNKHLEFHQSTNCLQCKICAYKAVDFADLFAHRFSHLPARKKSTMHCFLCSRLYLRLNTLEFHFRGVHLKKKPGLCKECKKSFTCYKHFVLHVMTHSGRLFSCEKCPKTFKYEKALKKHCFTHMEQKTYMCDMCGFRTRQLSELRSHTFRHHQQHEPILCNHCGKTFKNSETLREHMLRAKGGSIPCPTCGKAFRSEKKMLNHFKWHRDDKPFVCDSCGNAYKCKAHLKVHMLCHTGERPHVCGTCDMRFFTSSILKRHILTHTGEKPHGCNICGKKFAGKNNLRVHVARHTKALLEKVDPPNI